MEEETLLESCLLKVELRHRINVWWENDFA